jgi:hypothetical protein
VKPSTYAEDKRATLERIYDAWLATPNQRLGQLLMNATAERSHCPLFYAQDSTLVDAVEAYAQMVSRNPR